MAFIRKYSVRYFCHTIYKNNLYLVTLNVLNYFIIYIQIILNFKSQLFLQVIGFLDRSRVCYSFVYHKIATSGISSISKLRTKRFALNLYVYVCNVQYELQYTYVAQMHHSMSVCTCFFSSSCCSRPQMAAVHVTSGVVVSCAPRHFRTACRLTQVNTAMHCGIEVALAPCRISYILLAQLHPYIHAFTCFVLHCIVFSCVVAIPQGL